MALIRYDAKNFWNQFLGALNAGMPQRDGANYSKKEIESHFGVNAQSVNSLFGDKGRKYQEKWTDAQVGAFNAGTPSWEIRRTLLASILWGSKAEAVTRCKAFSVKRDEFEAAMTAAFSENSSDLENWKRGCDVAVNLVSRRFAGSFKADVETSVEKFAAHFIGKLTHSNAKTGAVLVRSLSVEETALPYLYTGSIGEIPLDCSVNSSGEASAYRRMLECAERVRAEGESASSAEDVEVARAFDDAVKKLGTGEDRAFNRAVDFRLRQLVLPRPDASYVALAPLGAAGISRRLMEHSKAIFARRIDLPLGGTKAGNVTSISEATRAYFFDTPPHDDQGVVIYLRLLRRGFSIDRRDKDLLEALNHYGFWLSSNASARLNTVAAADLEKRASGITRIVSKIYEDIREISRQVRDYLTGLTEEESAASVDGFAEDETGIIEYALVTGIFSPAFIKAVTGKILRLIDGHEYSILDGNAKSKVAIVLSIDDQARLSRVIADLLRERITGERGG